MKLAGENGSGLRDESAHTFYSSECTAARRIPKPCSALGLMLQMVIMVSVVSMGCV